MNDCEPIPPSVIDAFLDRTRDLCPGASAADPKGAVEDHGARWRDMGLRPGDVVALALPNGIGLLRHFFGVLAAGGVPALVAPNAPAARLHRLIAALGARAIVAAHIPREIKGLERHGNLGRMHVGLFTPGGAPAASPGEVILLTSGTTGFSTGCVFSMDALLLNARRHVDSIGQQAEDTVLVNLPLHFSFGLVAQALATLQCGGRLIVSGPPFHPGSYVRAIEDCGVTVSSLTPVLVRVLLRTGMPMPGSLRLLTVGGDALPAELVGQMQERMEGREFYLTYGLTQAGPRVSTLAVHRESPGRYGSVGLPLEGTRVWIENSDGGSGPGQLMVSSATVMRRRIGDSRQPADANVEPATVATGDRFDMDEDGYLFFRGRTTDFIVRRGDKLCLASIREAATQLPHVLRAKTSIVEGPDGECDYDIVLSVQSSSPPSVEAYRTALRRILCRSEMPRELSVLPEDGSCREYK